MVSCRNILTTLLFGRKRYLLSAGQPMVLANWILFLPKTH